MTDKELPDDLILRDIGAGLRSPTIYTLLEEGEGATEENGVYIHLQSQTGYMVFKPVLDREEAGRIGKKVSNIIEGHPRKRECNNPDCPIHGRR